MSAAEASARNGPARQWLAASGLLPLARGVVRTYFRLRGAGRREFRLTIDGEAVRFVTTTADARRFFYRRYRAGDLHEPPVSAELVRRARAARVFADVGAHVGYYSCIAGAVNKRLRLFLFEMNRELIPAIAQNLRANGRADAVVVDRPVADRRRLVSYPRSNREPGLRMHAPDAGEGYEQVEAIALDQYFAEAGCAPDLVKIDVEGAEVAVLRGATGIIARHHPVLFVEVHPAQLADFGASVAEVYGFLRGHGYELHCYLGHRSNGALPRSLELTAEPPDRTHMLLCV